MLIIRLYTQCCLVIDSHVVKTFLALSLDCASSVLIYLASIFLVAFRVNPGMTGLALSSALQLLLSVPWFFKMLFDLTLSMESVSALIYFGDHVRKEVCQQLHRIGPSQNQRCLKIGRKKARSNLKTSRCSITGMV